MSVKKLINIFEEIICQTLNHYRYDSNNFVPQTKDQVRSLVEIIGLNFVNNYFI